MTYGLELLLAGKNAETRAARIWRGLLLGAAAVVVSIVFVVLTRRAMATSHWKPTPCRIVESSVDVSDDESEAPYALSLSYTFETPAGPTVCSTYSNLTNPRGRDAAELFALARRWPAGLQATCYVNPVDPQKALLVLPNVRLWQASTATVLVMSLLLIVGYCIPQLTRPTPKPRPRQSKVERFYIALWTIACAITLVWMSLVPLVQNAAAADWPAVPCTVEHARLTLEQLHGEVPLTLYRTDILYRYVFHGVEYHSNQYSPTEIASPLAGGRRRRVAQPQSTCFVNPSNPQQAVLTRRVSPTQMLSVWIALLFLLGVYALIPRHRRAGLDTVLRRSRWTIGSTLLLLVIATVVGFTVMP